VRMPFILTINSHYRNQKAILALFNFWHRFDKP
jgi:hypothetical protein